MFDILITLLLFVLFEPVARVIWGWTGLYEVTPDVIKSDEESKVFPLDIIKWMVGITP